jgi:uncharacterized protein involved in exopolysaccharide biosynthesis
VSLFSGKFASAAFIAAVGLAVGISAWAFSKTMDKAWSAETNIMIVKDNDRDSLAQMAGQLGGVAALLGGSAGGRDVNEALATLKSRLLVVEFLSREKRLADIQNLISEGDPKKLGDPVDARNTAVSFFQQQVLSVDYEPRTSIITVGITWRDRQQAADWANAYVAAANELMRQRAITEAAERIKYLRNAADNAATVDLRNSIYSLLEGQIRSEMLASTRPEFGFRVFDPAVRARADAKVRPKSALFGLVGVIFGGTLGAGILLLRRRRATI